TQAITRVWTMHCARIIVKLLLSIAPPSSRHHDSIVNHKEPILSTVKRSTIHQWLGLVTLCATVLTMSMFAVTGRTLPPEIIGWCGKWRLDGLTRIHQPNDS